MRMLFDSFNARYLSFEEVANSFIPNNEYYELANNNHSLLMGPRGSGKTTLLKMLTPLCQNYWQNNHDNAQKLPFIGIYIPTDIQWKRQLDQLENYFKKESTANNLIGKQLVKINVLISLCKTFQDIIKLNGIDENSLDVEFSFCVSLSKKWKLDDKAKTLDQVIQLLLGKITELNKDVNLAIYNNQQEIEIKEDFAVEYFDLLKEGCNLFQSMYASIFKNNDGPVRWALCFDELEIAPKWLQDDLLDKLRSSDQNFLFKLTTSPIINLYDKIKKESKKIDAQLDQDYKIVRTWTYNDTGSKQWEIFCQSLFKRKLEKIFGEEVQPSILFGTDSLDRNISELFPSDKPSPYYKGGYTWLLLKEAILIDPTFKKFLTDKGISINNPEPKDSSQLDQIFRKIKPIVTYRYAFSKAHGRKRSRKNPGLYYGIPFLYLISDGNPRSAIGLLDEFIANIETSEKGPKALQTNKQSQILKAISKKYLKLISSHPESNNEYKKRYVNLGELLSAIGGYFREKMLFDNFTMDPSSSFVVDKDVPQEIIELLELALHLGAIIYLDPEEGISSSGLIGKKFRLTFLLYPEYTLPKREYNSINLSTIVKSPNKQMVIPNLLFEL